MLSALSSPACHQAGGADKAAPRGSGGPDHHMPAVRGAIPGGCRPRKLGAGGGRCASISPALGSPASSDRQEMTDRRSGGNGYDCTMSLAHWILSRTYTAVPCGQPTVMVSAILLRKAPIQSETQGCFSCHPYDCKLICAAAAKAARCITSSKTPN